MDSSDTTKKIFLTLAKAKQQDIFVKEQKLHEETQKLLHDLLSFLTPEQGKQLNGVQINDFDMISQDSVAPTAFEVCSIEDPEDNVHAVFIVDLSQKQMKELIDEIILNIL